MADKDFNPLDPLGIFKDGDLPAIPDPLGVLTGNRLTVARGTYKDPETYKPPPDLQKEVVRQFLLAGLMLALPDEKKAWTDYATMAKLLRDIGRDDFAKRLDEISTQEASHYQTIGYMLEQLKRG